MTYEEAYDTTKNLIEESIVDGNFTIIMDQYAKDEHCLALLNASATTLADVSGYNAVGEYNEEDDKFEIDTIFLVTLVVPSIVVIIIGTIIYRRLLTIDKEAAANDKLFRSSITNGGNGRSESVNPMTQKNNLSERLLA